MPLEEVQNRGRQTCKSQSEEKENPADGHVGLDYRFAPEKFGFLEFGEDVAEGHGGAESGEGNDDLEEGFEPCCHGDAGVLGYGFDAGEAGVVLVRGNGVIVIGCGLGVCLDGLVWWGLCESGF